MRLLAEFSDNLLLNELLGQCPLEFLEYARTIKNSPRLETCLGGKEADIKYESLEPCIPEYITINLTKITQEN